MITKPPEIMAVFAIATNQPSPRPPVVFAVFDSHSRPTHHPNGAAFSFFGNAADAAAYLSSLLSFDPEILKDPRMQWQAQLLSQFSAHCFVAGNETLTMRQMELELFKSNIDLLDTRSVLTEVKETMGELQMKYAGAMKANARLKDEVLALRLEIQEKDGAGTEVDQEGEPMDIEVEVKEVKAPRAEKADKKGKGKAKALPDDIPTPPAEDGFVSWHDSGVSVQSISDALKYIPGASWITSKARGEAGPSGSRATSELPQTTPRSYASVAGPHSHNKTIEGQSERDHMMAAKLHIEDDDERRREAEQARQNQLLADAHIAAKIQRELDKEMEEERAALELMKQHTFECGICLEETPQDDLAVPDSCTHSFCRDCLAAHAKASLEENKYPIWCPVCQTQDKIRKEDRGGTAN